MQEIERRFAFPSFLCPMNMTPTEKIALILHYSEQYKSSSPDRILLGSSDIPNELRPEVARQLEYRHKMRTKYPSLCDRGLYLPAAISFEQSSSEKCAKHKWFYSFAQEVLTDGTGGLGIDFLALAQGAKRAYYIEQDAAFVAAARYNIPHLLSPNETPELSILEGDLIKLLPEIVGWGTTLLYFDPARRDEGGERTYALADTLPNPVTVCEELRSLDYQGRILIKLSPMIDITDTLRQLPALTSLEVVALQGEVKELLAFISHVTEQHDEWSIPIRVTDLDAEGKVTSSYEATLGEERACPLSLASSLEEYLFVPHAGIFKSGLYKSLAQRMGLALLHPNSHLYTGSERRSDFPGKCYRIVETIPFSSHLLKKLHKEYPRADFSARNFPLRPEQFYAKSKIKAGDTVRLFGTTLRDNTPIILRVELV